MLIGSGQFVFTSFFRLASSRSASPMLVLRLLALEHRAGLGPRGGLHRLATFVTSRSAWGIRVPPRPTIGSTCAQSDALGFQLFFPRRGARSLPPTGAQDQGPSEASSALRGRRHAADGWRGVKFRGFGRSPKCARSEGGQSAGRRGRRQSITQRRSVSWMSGWRSRPVRRRGIVLRADAADSRPQPITPDELPPVPLDMPEEIGRRRRESPISHSHRSACFHTAFHHDLPGAAAADPAPLRAQGCTPLRIHGLDRRLFSGRKAARLGGPAATACWVIWAYSSGAEPAAVRDGKGNRRHLAWDSSGTSRPGPGPRLLPPSSRP